MHSYSYSCSCLTRLVGFVGQDCSQHTRDYVSHRPLLLLVRGIQQLQLHEVQGSVCERSATDPTQAPRSATSWPLQTHARLCGPLAVTTARASDCCNPLTKRILGLVSKIYRRVRHES